jgi:putative ABC transport system permease protein
VNLGTVATGNLLRNRFRVGATAVAVALAVVGFVLLRTVVSASEVAVTHAARDRVGTRHKVSFVMSLPRRYVDQVRAVPGVQAATWLNWFGGKNPRDPDSFFASLAVDPATFFTVYDEMSVPPAELQRWREDRQGVIVGDVLARQLRVRVGDRVSLQGTIFPGTWTFTVDGIYTATRRSVDRSQFLFHWNYLNESLPQGRRDQIGWMVARVDDPARAASIAQAIDRVFEDQDIQTLSMSEKALNSSFMAMMSGFLRAIDIISAVILGILTLLLGNTLSMGVRERTQEYGVLRALGFRPGHLAGFILGEAALLGTLSGALGVALSYPLVERGLGRWIEENMGGSFPYFRIETHTSVAALLLAVALAVGSAAAPAWRASRMTVTDALRRVD